MRTSETLLQIAKVGPERLTLAEVMERLGDRSFGAMFLLFAFAGFIPSIPGFTGLLGVALMLISGQLIIGRRYPWLPAFVASRGIKRESFAKASHRIAPWLRRLENLARPRLSFAASRPVERLVGAVVFLLALVIALPIPFLGNLPPAIAIFVFALGLIERDGLLILVGFVLSAAALSISGTLGIAAAAQLAKLF